MAARRSVKNYVKAKAKKEINQPTTKNNTIINLFNKQKSCVKCPVCFKLIAKHDINIHLDSCVLSDASGILEITIVDSEDESIRDKKVSSVGSSQGKRKLSDQPVQESPKKIKFDHESEKINFKLPYYLNSFILILKSVINHPEDSILFNEEDKNVFDQFFKLSVDAQKLYVRMFQRKLKWHQVSRINYTEIKENLNDLTEELIQFKFFVDGRESNDLFLILNLMQLNDLKLLLKNLNMNQWVNSSKTIIIDNVMKQSKQQKTLFFKSMDQVILKEAMKVFGKCFKVNVDVRRIFARVLLLFSLTSYIPNDDQKQQQQVFTLHLVNTNQLTFPDYPVLRNAHIFRNRDDLIRYEKIYELELDLANAMEKGNLDQALEIYYACRELVSSQSTENDDLHAHVLMLPRFLRQYSAGASLIRCLSSGVEVLEKLRKYEEAVEQLEKLLNQRDYHVYYRGRWTERLALNLEQHLKQPKNALDVVIAGLNDDYIQGGHKLGLYERAMRICKSPKNVKLKHKLKKIEKIEIKEIPKVFIEGRILPSSSSGKKTTFISQDSSDIVMSSVEEFAINHYKKNGFDEGVHGESSTFTSLFCLLFWNIIYMSGIPDVFRSPHQIAPLDLNSDYFYRQRKKDIDEKLEWIRKTKTCDRFDQIAACWTLHEGQTSLVNWDLFSSLYRLETFNNCVEGEILSKICERLAKNYRFTRSGFPDLVVWSTNEKIFKVVEVKGPNDRLSTKQTLWLDFLLGIGVSAEVCHVAGSGMKRLKKANISGDSCA